MKVVAVSFLLCAFVATVQSECPELVALSGVMRCYAEVKAEAERRGLPAGSDELDLPNPKRLKGACCLLKSTDTCFKREFVGECALLGQDLTLQVQQGVERKLGELRCDNVSC
ncbi:uncharacterized protein LOC135383906 [Ornithodoros turicata]|uniref:uncharacterized protein LOC135383906 n=1 Tax=Ornithodoros turicata TaxID=34597 RepID=UPI0031397D42